MSQNSATTPPGTVVLTKALIERCESLQRSYTDRSVQLLADPRYLDERGRPRPGWKIASVGRLIARADYAAALAARSPRWHRRQGERLQATLFDLDVSSGGPRRVDRGA